MKREEVIKLTIAEGLERLVLNNKKMESIVRDIQTYSAWNNQVKCPYGVTGQDSSNIKPSETFKNAQSKINSAMESFKDLEADMRLIKAAINYTNLHTKIETVLGIMSVHDAIYMKDVLIKTGSKHRDYGIIAQMYNAIASAQVIATQEVQKHNSIIMNSSLSEDSKKLSTADVIYFITDAGKKRYEDAVILFCDQVNKKLNSINAITLLLIPPVIE